MAESTVKGESVLIAEIPLSEVTKEELDDFMEKVPGAEVDIDEAKPGQPAVAKLRRNFIKIKPKT
jgi:hypothetical protein